MRAWGVVAGLAVACGKEAPPEDVVETECGGAGDPVLEVGGGGLSGFEPWVNGDTVLVEADGGGRYGFFADLYTHGLDTTAEATVFVRFSIGDDPTTEDLGATLVLQCPNEGPGWYGLFLVLDEAQQDAAVVATLAGLPMHLTATLTDQSGEDASVELDLVIGL